MSSKTNIVKHYETNSIKCIKFGNMQLVERHIFVGNKAMEQICHNAGLLQNFTNYHIKQAVLGYQERFSEYEFTGLCAEFSQPDYKNLPAQTAQQVVKKVFKNWKGFFAAMKARTKDPSKFKGKPKYPGYKKGKKLALVTFTSQQIKIKDGYIHFPKATNIEPVKTLHDNIAQVRLSPQTGCIIAEVVYEQQEVKAPADEKLFLSIDLGVNNLATAISNTGLPPFIINGKQLKSVNQFYNKKKAELQTHIGGKGASRRINLLTFRRNKIVEDYLHKTSSYIVDYCVKNKISIIVVGKNKQWKTNINIGKVNNQNFVQIPHAKLIGKLAYKAQLVGIKIVEQEESYTSKVDHLAGEKMEHHERYSGTRVSRGLFKSATGKVLNADVNGAIGIALKSNVADESFVKMIVSRGLAFRPCKICFC